MLISKYGQSFDWHDDKGNIYPDDCPYFEGKEILGRLNADNEVVDYELSVYINDDGIEKTITVPLNELATSYNKMSVLAKRGLLIKSRNTKDAFDLLQTQAIALMKHATIKHTRLGFTNVSGQTAFLQEQNTVGGIKYLYDGKIKLHSGKSQDYDNFLHTTVFKSKNLTLAYMIGMSAPVVSLLSNENIVTYKTIMVNFAGKSSTGKSTLAKLALSPFGNPSFDLNSLGITQTTTENAVYDALDGVNGMPRVLDDINQNSKLNMEQLIYSVSAGEPKRRMGKKYQGVNTGWTGTVVITTETPIILDTAQKGGVHARVLTMEMEQWASSKEEAELVSVVVQQNYGWTGEDFVAHLLNDIEYLKARFEKIRKEVDGKITVRDNLTGRISAQIAAIALTADSYLRYYPDAFEWSYSDLIEPFIKGEQRMVYDRDVGEKILEIVKEYSTTNGALFDKEYVTDMGYHLYQSTNAVTSVGKIVEVYDSNTHELIRKAIYIYNNNFKSVMIKYSVNDYNAGLHLLKFRGQLKTDKDGRLTTKLKGIRAYCFLIAIPNESDEGNDTNGGDEPDDDAGCYA